VLPLGHPKSVITCPGCGAKSLPREAAQELGREPVDLTVARTRADVLEEYDFDAGAETIRAMAVEIDQLRAEVSAAHAAGVAEERARCLAVVRYEAWNFGAGDEPHNTAQRMSESIASDIKSGRVPSDPPT
jgi:hypothetical protein